MATSAAERQRSCRERRRQEHFHERRTCGCGRPMADLSSLCDACSRSARRRSFCAGCGGAMDRRHATLCTACTAQREQERAARAKIACQVPVVREPSYERLGRCQGCRRPIPAPSGLCFTCATGRPREILRPAERAALQTMAVAP